MNQRIFALLFVLVLLCGSCAFAEEDVLPGVSCFSPGMARFDEALEAHETVHSEAALTLEDFAYARDLSVLSEMLSGMVFAYTGTGDAFSGTDVLTLTRGDETILSAALLREAEEAQLTLDGESYALTGEAAAALFGNGAAWSQAVESTSLIERYPLTRLKDELEAMDTDTALPMGFALTRAFDVTHGMSDDGERMTRLEFTGEAAQNGGAPWSITGKIFQPGNGKAPKETWEITLRQDEENFFDVVLSSTRKEEFANKRRQGKATVDTTLRIDGKLAGSGVSAKLTFHNRNTWTKNADALAEKIVISGTFSYVDKRPGMRNFRLNDISAELRDEITLSTQAGETLPPERVDRASIFVKMDGNTFLNAAADVRTRLGEEAEALAFDENAQAVSDEELTRIAEQAVQRAAASVYGQLGAKTKEKLLK